MRVIIERSETLRPGAGAIYMRTALDGVRDMSNSEELFVQDYGSDTALSRPAPDDWIERLAAGGQAREDAIAGLHALLLKAARHQVRRMPQADSLGEVRRDEVILAAADEATFAVLSRLGTFEGRSRFTTWAYKFGILHAGVEVRRAIWSGKEVQLDAVAEPRETQAEAPDAYAEGRDMARAVRQGLMEALTPHQRRVALALLVEEVPIDVLADRLGTTRGSLYKTLHDARRRLRAHLEQHGYQTPQVSRGGGR